MKVVKLRRCSCTTPRALTCNQQPTAVVESFSRGALEAISDSSAHKGSYRMEPAPLSPPSLRPNFLVLLCACMSGGAMRQIRRCNSCSAGLRAHAHAPTQARTHAHKWTPTAAGKHPPKGSRRPLMHAITQSRPGHMSYQTYCNCTATLLGPLCRTDSMLYYQTEHTHAGTHSMSIFGLLGYLALIPSTAPTILF